MVLLDLNADPPVDEPSSDTISVQTGDPILHQSCSSLTLFSELILSPQPKPCTLTVPLLEQGGLPITPAPTTFPPHPSLNQNSNTSLFNYLVPPALPPALPCLPPTPQTICIPHPVLPRPATHLYMASPHSQSQTKHPSQTTPLTRTHILQTIPNSNPSLLRSSYAARLRKGA